MADDTCRGTIRGRNLKLMRFALLLGGGRYIVFELLGGVEPELGDEISGFQRRSGGQTVRNETERRSLRVFVEWLEVSKEVAGRELRRTGRPPPQR
jgi:hypothetical protein